MRRRSDHFVICGQDTLALRIVEELRRLDEICVVIVKSRKHKRVREMTRLGAEVVEAQGIDESTLRRAGLPTARALALVEQNDVGNIQTALLAEELNPHIRLVVRMFNVRLSERIQRLLLNCTILSAAEMAAPFFVDAALGQSGPVQVRIDDCTFAAVPPDYTRSHVVCPLANYNANGGGPLLLPTDFETADLVLAQISTKDSRQLRRPRRKKIRWMLTVKAFFFTRMFRVIVGLVGLLAVAMWIFHATEALDWLDAAFTIVAISLGQDFDTSAPNSVRAISVAVSLIGIAMVPILTAAVVEARLRSQLSESYGGTRKLLRDHIVVCGLGNLGVKIVEELERLGHMVVAIEKNEDAMGVSAMRRLGVPIIIGDASLDHTLRTAHAGTASCLIAATDSDIANIETGLNGRELRPELRVVLRLFDIDLAARVEKTLGFAISRGVAFLAAPAFAAALMDQRILATIPVGRRVLLVVDVRVQAGSPLDGAPIKDAYRDHNVRVFGLRRGESITWIPEDSLTLGPGDHLISVVTRLGRSELILAARCHTTR